MTKSAKKSNPANTNNLEDFKVFLSLMNFDKQVENPTLLLNVSPTELKTLTKDKNTILLTRVRMSGTFEDLGELGIDNLPLVTKFCNSVDLENYSLQRKDNHLIIKSGKATLKAVLRNAKYIDNTLTDEKFDEIKARCGNDTFEITEDQLNELARYSGTISYGDFILTGSKTGLDFDFTAGDNTLAVKLDVPTTEFTNKFSSLLIDLLLKLRGWQIVCSTTTKAPIYVVATKENLKFEFVLNSKVF
jgi:hypothetical protein